MSYITVCDVIHCDIIIAGSIALAKVCTVVRYLVAKADEWNSIDNIRPGSRTMATGGK